MALRESFVWALGVVGLACISFDAKACSSVPIELLRYSEKAGAKEIPNFFGTDLGYHLPAFSYGLLKGEYGESAAILVMKGAAKYQILTVRRQNRSQKPPILVQVFPPLVLDHNPHGLRIERGKFKSLAGFVCVADTKKISKITIPSEAPIIVCENDGEEESYVYIEGDWWGHALND